MVSADIFLQLGDLPSSSALNVTQYTCSPAKAALLNKKDYQPLSNNQKSSSLWWSKSIVRLALCEQDCGDH